MRILLILPVCAAAWSCAAPADAPLSPIYGLAVASMQSQIIPYEPTAAAPESSGERGALAIARYEKGEPKELESQTTSSLSVSLLPTSK